MMIRIFSTRASTEVAGLVCARLNSHLKTRYKKAGKDEKQVIERIWAKNKHEYGKKEFILGLAETTEFSDGEIKTVLNESVRGKDCFIIHTPYTEPSPVLKEILNATKKNIGERVREYNGIPENTFESFTLIDTLNQARAASVTLVNPYLPFARQDHLVEREGITVALLAKLYKASGLDGIVTVDLHSSQIQGMFEVAGISIEHFHAEKLLVSQFKKDHSITNFVVASPDAGGADRAKSFAKLLGTEAVMCYKKRNYKTANTIDMVEVIGEVAGKRVILVDDIIDTAGTMKAVSEKLMKEGAKEVFMIGVHGLLSGPALDRLSDLYKRGILKGLYVTDSICREEAFKKEHPWYVEVSLASVLAEMVYNLSQGLPLSGITL